MIIAKSTCRTLRKLFKVDPADYMISICGNDALRELSSPGKSGSFFYLTNDDKYMIKTMKKAEVKVSSFFCFKYGKHKYFVFLNLLASLLCLCLPVSDHTFYGKIYCDIVKSNHELLDLR